MNDNYHDIPTLLCKKVNGTISGEKDTILSEWRDSSMHNKKVYEQFTSTAFLEQEMNAIFNVDKERYCKEMEERISAVENIAKNKKKGSIPSFLKFMNVTENFWTAVRIAAVLLLLIVGGAFFLHRDYKRVIPPEISADVQLAMLESMESGHHAADVECIDGREAPIITQEEKGLYHVDDDFAEQLFEAKRVTTYQDKEFWVTLEDGSLVHLNYNSRLIYPEKFGDRRDVILEGEAYFMVAKDKSRQFVVHTPHGDLKVYGTEFNVNTRKEECSLSVVLVRGSVGFTSSNGIETMLQPNQELTASNSQVTLKDIDTAPYVAWNTGLFVFKSSSLEYLMSVLSQWYGIHHVTYANDSLRNIRFTGNLKRYGSIDRILEVIMMVCDLKIQLSDDVITIQE